MRLRAVLVVARWREESRRRAQTCRAIVAVRNAMAGMPARLVVFSGATVAISLLALAALPVRVHGAASGSPGC